MNPKELTKLKNAIAEASREELLKQKAHCERGLKEQPQNEDCKITFDLINAALAKLPPEPEAAEGKVKVRANQAIHEGGVFANKGEVLLVTEDRLKALGKLVTKL